MRPDPCRSATQQLRVDSEPWVPGERTKTQETKKEPACQRRCELNVQGDFDTAGIEQQMLEPRR